jgi:redox-sensitive bicupin YhaK (pirin superfamily)
MSANFPANLPDNLPDNVSTNSAPLAGSTPRPVSRIVTAHEQTEGGGFVVRRPLPKPGFVAADPFLLIDEMGPVAYGPGEAIGAPDHPHRGFETVTYILEGEMEHEDSAGHRGVLGPGDVQWMTAGGGVIHSETPTARMLREGGRAHGFQIWVNLPARLKMMQPRYQELAAARIPGAATPDGRARVRLVAGAALGVEAAIETQTPIVYQDWSLDDGADVTLPLAADHRALVYVFQGEVGVGGDAQAELVKDGQLAILGDGDAVRFKGAPGGGRLLLLAGVPIGEPVARYGPFVMNTQAELETAFRDYQSGRMGEITRTARVG